jgi:hypothetical protein
VYAGTLVGRPQGVPKAVVPRSLTSVGTPFVDVGGAGAAFPRATSFMMLRLLLMAASPLGARLG